MNSDDYQTCINFLKNQIFLGHYSGRHRVEDIDDFRDVIDLHSTEDVLKTNIDAVLNIVNRSRPSVWVAISDTSRNGAYSLWVQLDGIAFGYYWFQIKHVRLTAKELLCVVSVLRSVPAQLMNPTFSFSQGFECAMRALRGGVGSGGSGGESNVSTDRNESNASREETNPRREENRSRGSSTENTNRENRGRQANNPFGSARPFSFLKDFRGLTFDQLRTGFSNEEFGVGLIKMALLFCFFGTIGAMNLIYESLAIFVKIVAVTGDVTIKGIHAIARLVESLSPIFLGVLNFVGKLVTGLYILIAMLFGYGPYPPTQQRAPQPRLQALMYRK